MPSQDIVIVVAIFVSFSFPIEAHFTCVGTCYKGSFIEESHVTVNKALIGHTFQNLTVYTPHQCLSACVFSCRCLAFQIEGTRCELLDQDRLLASADFYDVQGYKHFDVKQELARNVSKTVCNDCYFSDFISFLQLFASKRIHAHLYSHYFVHVHIHFFMHSICTRSL